MIGALLVLGLIAAVGIPAARWLDPDAGGGRLAGEAILLGLALPGVFLGFASIGTIPWSWGLVVSASLVWAAAASYRIRRRHRRAPLLGTWGPPPSWALLADGATLLLIVGYGVFALVSVGSENDFIGIWGIKGKVFFERGGIDWNFLRLRGNDYAHPDYPILLPLVFDWIALVSGEWRESLLGIVYPLGALAVLAVIREELRRESRSATIRAFATFVLAPLALSPWIGLAELPLLAFGTVGLLLLRRGCAETAGRTISVAALFLGLAASVKNEGLALCAASLIAVALNAPERWKSLRAMWPIVFVVSPWLLARVTYDLSSYFARGTLGVRLAGALDPRRTSELGRLLVENTPPQFALWCGIGLAVLLGWRRILERDRVIVTALFLQICAFIAAYLVSPFDLEWHVKWSWERLISQIQLPVAFVAVTAAVARLDDLRLTGAVDESGANEGQGVARHA